MCIYVRIYIHTYISASNTHSIRARRHTKIICVWHVYIFYIYMHLYITYIFISTSKTNFNRARRHIRILYVVFVYILYICVYVYEYLYLSTSNTNSMGARTLTRSSAVRAKGVQIYIYIHIYTYVFMNVYIYVYIWEFVQRACRRETSSSWQQLTPTLLALPHTKSSSRVVCEKAVPTWNIYFVTNINTNPSCTAAHTRVPAE